MSIFDIQNSVFDIPIKVSPTGGDLEGAYLGNVGHPQPLKIPQDDRHKATPITITTTATSKILFFNIIKSYRSYQYTKHALCGANGIGKQIVPTAVAPGKHVSLQ
jgi:hypothetical protein